MGLAPVPTGSVRGLLFGPRPTVVDGIGLLFETAGPTDPCMGLALNRESRLLPNVGLPVVAGTLALGVIAGLCACLAKFGGGMFGGVGTKRLGGPRPFESPITVARLSLP